MSGRRPKPTAVKKLEGNPGRRPLNKAEPVIGLNREFAEPPEVIAGDARAAAEWRRLAPLLKTARVLTDADYGSLLAVCQQWSLYLDAMSKVTALIVTAKSGYPMPNPYLGVANRALSACIKLWIELGCTPSSRSRVVRTDGTGEGDPFAEFDEPIHASHSSH